MKRLLVLLAVAGTMFADTLTIGTGVPSTIEGNSLTGINVATIPDPAWHPALWTSTWESIQLDSTSPPIPFGEVVDFYFMFTLSGPATAGSMGLLVDDSARVDLNGFTLVDNIGSVQGVNCAASKPNCRDPLWLDILPQLVIGPNRIDVWTSQDMGATPYGIDALISVNYNAVPEPVSFILIGLGLVTLWGVRHRIAG